MIHDGETRHGAAEDAQHSHGACFLTAHGCGQCLLPNCQREYSLRFSYFSFCLLVLHQGVLIIYELIYDMNRGQANAPVQTNSTETRLFHRRLPEWQPRHAKHGHATAESAYILSRQKTTM